MNRLRNANQGLVTGFDCRPATPMVTFPYANLNTSVNGQRQSLVPGTGDQRRQHQLQWPAGFVAATLLARAWRTESAIPGATTFADFVDNLTGGSTPANAYNYGLERGNSPFDVRHRFVGNAHLESADRQRRHVLNNGKLASRLIGGWQLNASSRSRPARLSRVTAPDQSEHGRQSRSRARTASAIHTQGATTRSIVNMWEAVRRVLHQPGGVRGSGRGHLRQLRARAAFHGPGLENVDLSLFKNFAVTEAVRVEFRGEFFNAFNHANFTQSQRRITPASLGSFGKVFSTVTDPREIQFALNCTSRILTFMKLSAAGLLAVPRWASGCARLPTPPSIQPAAVAHEICRQSRFGRALAEPEETAHARQPDHGHRASRR